MARLLETDSLSNQNIVNALAIGAHTCATAVRLVYVRVLVKQVAGNGDYIIYATLTKSAVEYRVIPITTANAASGVMAIAFVSVGIPMDVSDVLTVYIDGLAGDTTTPDTQVDFYEADYLRPTAADKTLDVSDTGEAGVDWNNVGTPGATVGLSGTTVKATTDVSNTVAAKMGGAARTPIFIAPNAVDVTVYVKLISATTGLPATGLVITNLDAVYIRDRAAAVKSDLTALALVTSAHGDNKAIEVDSTNAPGVYRVDLEDAAFAAGVARVQLGVVGAAIDPAYIEVELAPWLTPITGVTVRAVNASDAALGLAGEAATAVTGLATESAPGAIEGLATTAAGVAADYAKTGEAATAVVGLATTTDVTTAESNIRGTDNDDLKDISDQIDALKIDPMVIP